MVYEESETKDQVIQLPKSSPTKTKNQNTKAEHDNSDRYLSDLIPESSAGSSIHSDNGKAEWHAGSQNLPNRRTGTRNFDSGIRECALQGLETRNGERELENEGLG